ncbi:Uncharacterised protein [Citrobacter koseri]|nr:Uncharacterised protein [Citrobacter koseri]
MFIVFQCDILVFRDLPVGCEAVCDVYLPGSKGVVAQADFGKLAEGFKFNAVGLLQPFQAVLTVAKLRTCADGQFRRGFGEVGERFQVVFLGGLFAHQQCVAVVHAGWLQPGEMILLLVGVADLLKHLCGIGGGLSFDHCAERRTCIFRVHINFAFQQRGVGD